MPSQPSSGNTAAYADPLLSQVAISHVSPMDVLGQACPIVGVQKRTGKYPVFGPTDFQRALAKERSDEGAFARIGYGLTQSDYECVNKGIETTVSDDLRSNWDIGSGPDVVATRLIMDAHTMKRNVDIAAMYTGTTWTGGTLNLDSGSNTNWDESAEDAMTNLDAAIQAVADKIGVEPNTMITSNYIMRSLRKAPTIKSFISGGATPQNPAIATRMALQLIFPSLTKIVSVPNVRVTSVENATTTVRANLWGNYVWIGWQPERAEFGAPAAAYCFRWKQPQVVTYREQKFTRDVLQAQESYVAVATMTDAGYLISNVLNAY